MDWACKAVLTAALAALVVVAGRRFGRRAGGLLAGLPVLTGPGLVWIACEQGAVYAAGAAIASVAACGALAAFALAYARCAGRCGPARCLAVALGSATAFGALAHEAGRSLDLALAFAVVSCAAALCCLPATRDRPAVRDAGAREVTLTSGGAGLVGACATHAAPWLGSFGTGVALSLPVVSAGAVVLEHRLGGPLAATLFLKGYVRGLLSRAVFGSVFAIAVAPLGPAVAVGVAVVGALALAFLIGRSRFVGPPCATRARVAGSGGLSCSYHQAMHASWARSGF